MNEQQTDIALCDLEDWLHEAGIEALAIRPSRRDYRRSLVINESEIPKGQALIDAEQLELHIIQIGGKLASIEPRIF